MAGKSELKFSCADFTFPLMQQRSVFQLLQLLGIHAVDLGIFAGRSHIQPAEVQANPNAVAHVVKGLADDAGLEVSDVFLQTGAHPGENAANNPHPEIRQSLRDTFRAVVEFASALECRHITGLPGVQHEHVSAQDSLWRAAEEAAWRVQEAGKAGIEYSIEPHVGSVCPDPESTLALLSKAEELKLTLDYTHFISASIANEAIHPLLPWMNHFHARSARPGQLQTVIQENTVDYEAIVRWMKEAGYSGFVCLEYAWLEWMGCNRTDNISETILMREHLRECLRRCSE